METQNSTKTALITGAASGIGQELARLFAKDGYKLVLVDRNEEGMQVLANHFKNQYGLEATLITKDLSDPKSPDEIYAEPGEKGLKIDVLVNDAGFGTYGKFATETDIETELAIVQTNATALMHLTKLYLKDMVERNNGKVLMLGSEVSVAPAPLQAVYGATKAFIKSFAEAIRNELKGTNITVTVLMPGATNTNFFKTAGAENMKTADPSQTANPADVAKAGYEALMSGDDHVVAGWMNKVRVAFSHILPDPLVAAGVRSSSEPKDPEAEKQQKMITSIIVGAAVLGGIWLLSRDRSVKGYAKSLPRKAKYQYKKTKAEWAANNALDSATDSVKDTYKKAKSKVEDVLS